MNDEQLREQVRQIMADTFGIDESDLPDDPSQSTIARWTSLIHMVLLVALEEHFGLSFSMDEMTCMTSLSRIIKAVQQRVRVPA